MATPDLTAFPNTCGYDPSSPSTLADLMEAPIASDADADTRFLCLQQILIDQGDRRAPFATLYSMTTTNVIAAINAGQFQDGVWVGKYLNEFAELYRGAFYNYQVGNLAAVSASWQIAFNTAATKQELIVQDLALGVNAHVDGDLAYALQAVGIGEPGTALRASRYADHTAVNNVLGAEIQSALAKIAVLYAPGLGMLPAAAQTFLDDTFFAALVTGRQVAWDHAVTLVDGNWLSQDETKTAIILESTTIADGILAPELDPSLMATLRKLEGS